MTGPERRLWACLRRRQCHGHRFRRQHPIGPYVVDFCCVERRLVIEVDGESHVGRAEEDQRRQAAIEAAGFHVLRVTNDDVWYELEAVWRMIEHALLGGAAPDPLPGPPPERGREREGKP
jgi:very-short-patch-repair endonuclease